MEESANFICQIWLHMAYRITTPFGAGMNMAILPGIIWTTSHLTMCEKLRVFENIRIYRYRKREAPAIRGYIIRLYDKCIKDVEQ